MSRKAKTRPVLDGITADEGLAVLTARYWDLFRVIFTTCLQGVWLRSSDLSLEARSGRG